jgi:predicted RNA polymerase sigma factor
MRKIREVLRLKLACGLSARQISQSCVLARSTVNDYLCRAKVADVKWPLPSDWDDEKLEKVLFPAVPTIPRSTFTEPDWNEIYRESIFRGGRVRK